MTGVIQTVLAAQLVGKTGLLEGAPARNDSGQLREGGNRKN